jgi:hypothetical protein
MNKPLAVETEHLSIQTLLGVHGGDPLLGTLRDFFLHTHAHTHIYIYTHTHTYIFELTFFTLRRKPQLTICISVRPWPHLDMHIWVSSFWILRMLHITVLEAIWNSGKGTGLF